MNGVLEVPIWCLFILITAIDQAVKFYVQSVMTLGMSVPVLPGIFHITYILNPGAAFGILENQRGFFIVVALAILVGAIMLYPRLKKEPWLLRSGVGLLLGGAAGNLIDRMQTGYVVDFFDFRIWPIFNVADIAIVAGVGMILYTIFWQTKDDGAQNDERNV